MKTLTMIGLLLFLNSALVAQKQKELDCRINRLDTKIKAINRGKVNNIVVSASLELEAPKNKSFSIYIQWIRENRQILRNGKTDLFKKWKQICVPAKYRYSRPGDKNTIFFNDIEVEFTFEELEQCGLPADQTIRLYATCEVWSIDQAKFIESGWNDRVPLIVTTNAKGMIKDANTFPTKPFFKSEPDSQRSIGARKMVLQSKHLKLKPGASVYEVKSQKHVSLPVLTDGKLTASLRGPNRGYFFEAIKNEDQAIELARLAHPNATVLKSKAEFEDIIANLRLVKDWKEEEWVKGTTDQFETRVEPVAELGFKVHSVYIGSFFDKREFRHVVKSTTFVAFDGRVSEQTKILLQAPMYQTMNLPIRIEPEFGLLDFKPSGNAMGDSINRMQAATTAYRKALLATVKNNLVVPTMVKSSKTAAKIPAPWDLAGLLTSLKDWPADDEN